jgi:hypothetical protein
LSAPAKNASLRKTIQKHLDHSYLVQFLASLASPQARHGHEGEEDADAQKGEQEWVLRSRHLQLPTVAAH